MPDAIIDAPVVHEDQPNAGIPFLEDSSSPSRSQALEDLPPDMNSPHKPSPRRESKPASVEPRPIAILDGAESEHTKENSAVTDTTLEPHSVPELCPSEDLDTQMSELLERQRSALSSRHDIPVKAQRRTHRKLGRAPSGNNGDSSFTRPTRLEIEDSVDTASPLTLDASGERIPLPSQQLSYDAPGDEEHRRLMSRKLGTTFEDESIGKRIGAIGTVKDAELIGKRSGVGSRVRGRHRDKEAR